jgi:uncharacterized protein RhaS with RHS repeats
MQARYYDPMIGRFYSNDPIDYRGVHSFNRYAYANNNPYRYTDPTGKCSAERSDSQIRCDVEDAVTDFLEPIIEKMIEGAGVENVPEGERDPEGDFDHEAGETSSLDEVKALAVAAIIAKAGGRKGGLRRKPGSLGKSKGTDALRRENKQVKDAANAAGGLTKEQRSKLHDEISGQGYDYHTIVEIAKEVKNGS